MRSWSWAWGVGARRVHSRKTFTEQMKKRATIRDVAAHAGVSIATVSKYINSAQRFTPGGERKIRAAIDALEYQSDPLARSMITGKTASVGAASLDIGNPHCTNFG